MGESFGRKISNFFKTKHQFTKLQQCILSLAGPWKSFVEAAMNLKKITATIKHKKNLRILYNIISLSVLFHRYWSISLSASLEPFSKKSISRLHHWELVERFYCKIQWYLQDFHLNNPFWSSLLKLDQEDGNCLDMKSVTSLLCCLLFHFFVKYRYISNSPIGCKYFFV